MAVTSRSFAVVGLGSFGSAVATELQRSGNTVAGIDIDEKRVSRVAEHLSSTAILDATDEDALREIGIDGYGAAIVAIGDDIEASILTTMNLKLVGVETIWVKAAGKAHHRILSKLGVARVIQPEQEMGRHIAQMLNNPAVQDYVSLGNGFHVVNILVPERMEGKTLDALKIGKSYDLQLLGLMRGTDYVDCDNGGLTLREKDKLLVLGKRADLRRFGDSL
ncbi:MAG: TrkA family potassium uptake protein [Phyllobacteriaceae bacterium]|jgi:trk system potassium uptake protein TrkA|nr:TrkA family potassium uptake protein [Phyllobacteriaceae bacterium]